MPPVFQDIDSLPLGQKSIVCATNSAFQKSAEEKLAKASKTNSV
jgi:hypothetical protein